MPNPPNIIINDVSHTYQNQILFDKLNMTIKSSQITCLLGPSGVGKSTLLRLIANLVPQGQDKNDEKANIYCDNSLPLQEQVSYLAQQDALLPWLTALENTLLGYRLRGTLTVQQTNTAKHLFKKMHLTHAESLYPSELSGGMRQRVALIRTLLEDKPIVLMDEPFSSLDAITRFELQTLAVELLKNRTVLLVTHDPTEALRMANEIYVLSGSPATIKSIAHLTTAIPRDISDPEFIYYQSVLFKALTEAKAISL